LQEENGSIVRFTDFKIRNFRGIINAHLPLSGKPDSRVHTLVGLNESGKTTILEAINHFSSKTENLEALELEGYNITDQNSLIPVSKRANFNDQVKISGTIELNAKDEKEIARELLKKNQIRLTRPIKK